VHFTAKEQLIHCPVLREAELHAYPYYHQPRIRDAFVHSAAFEEVTLHTNTYEAGQIKIQYPILTTLLSPRIP
jgi:hypothetical protein